MTDYISILQAAYDAAEPENDEDYAMIDRAVAAIVAMLENK